MKKIISLILSLTASVSFAGQCATVDCMINGVLPHMSSVMDLFSTLSYIIGAVFVYKSIIKFKENNESKGQVKITIPILYFIAGGLLVSLPYVITKGRETFSVTSQYDSQSAIVKGSNK